MPITLCIDFTVSRNTNDDDEQTNTAIKVVKWDDEKADTYYENIKTMIQTLPHVIDTNALSINSYVNKLTNIIISASDCMIVSSYTQTKMFRTKNKWFDKECSEKRKQVKHLLHRYSKHRCEEDKLNYIKSRNEYNSLLSRKKYLFSISKIDSLITNVMNNSNAFWKEIKSLLPNNKKVVNTIRVNDWCTFFSNMFNPISNLPGICNAPKITYCHNENELDLLCIPITINECIQAINNIKCKKAPGDDKILNEMIIHACDILAPILCSVFNSLITDCSTIECWQRSIISPIFKKGDVNTCSNYRPITLMSLLSKLYTSILNNRLTEYTVNLKIIPEEQAAFRKNYSTTDHIFTLYTLICKQFSQNRKLYVAFIDYRRCFDNINRQALFTVLERYGIVGHFLDVLKSLYTNVSAVVKINNNTFTSEFESPIGLKQGCILSPLLFSIFISVVTKCINEKGVHGLQLIPNYNILHHLFYADDNCVFSTTPWGLQQKLNILKDLSDDLGMEINLDKTKIVVFRKGGHLSRFEKWNYDGIPIEVVNSYNYLGITFSTRMSFTSISAPLIAKAKRSINEILVSLKSLSHFDLNLFLKLFDSKVFPVLSYGCELWGLHDMVNVERVHLYALKRFLNVSLHTSNNKVYSETGRYPISITHNIRCLKYWFKIKQLDQSRLTHQSYICLLNMCHKGHQNWVSMIKDILFTNGYGIVWIMGEVGNKALFLRNFKQTLIDKFMQGWSAKMSTDEHCTFYFSFKSVIETELYLKNHHMKLALRNILAKFRLGVSQINTHKHKFSNDETLKHCPFCVRYFYEDETHILLTCPLYDNIRTEYLSNAMSYYNNLQNCTHQLCSFMQMHQYQIAKFLFHSFLLRTAKLESRKF